MTAPTEGLQSTFEEFGSDEGGAAVAWTVMMRDWIAERRSSEYGWPSGEVWLLHEDLYWRSEHDQKTIAELRDQVERLEWMLDHSEGLDPDDLAARYEKENR